MLYSQSRDRYYVGYTSHAVEVRLQRHNGGWNCYALSPFYSTLEELKWLYGREISRPYNSRLD